MATLPSSRRVAHTNHAGAQPERPQSSRAGNRLSDVRRGTNRFDDHAGLQEAFVEVKLADLSPNSISFRSCRHTGIQWRLSRVSVCGRRARTPRVWQSKIRSRGIQPGLFPLPREEHEQRLTLLIAAPASHSRQRLSADFFFRGYTPNSSGAWNKDDATIHYDGQRFSRSPRSHR